MWTRNFLRMVKRKILHGHNIYVRFLCRFKQGHTHVKLYVETLFLSHTNFERDSGMDCG